MSHARSTERDVYLKKAAEIIEGDKSGLIYFMDTRYFCAFSDAFSDYQKRPMLGEQPPALVALQLCFYAAMLETDDG